MTRSNRKHDVVLIMSIRGFHSVVPIDAVEIMMGRVSQIESGTYDWWNVARDSFPHELKGGEVLITMVWPNGIGVHARFDCTIAAFPTIRGFQLMDHENGADESPQVDEVRYVGCYITVETAVDYSYRDVMKSLTYRVTECQYDVDNPVVGFNQDDGPIIGPNHGGYPGTANVVRNHGDHF